MSDTHEVPDEAHDSKVAEVLNSWLSMEQYLQQKKALIQRVPEQPGPSAIVVNLSQVPIKNVVDALSRNPDEAKNHQGVRLNFFIAKFLHAGWSSVTVGKSHDTKDTMKGKKVQSTNEVKERLSTMVGDHVVMHSFDLVNQRGTYVRSGKSEECIVLSPGMLVTSRVWGSKFDKTFKDQEEDIGIFDMALVQFGTHSITSSAKENGMMLEIKSFRTISTLTPSSFNMVHPRIMASNVQEFSIMRTRFLDGSHLGEDAVQSVKGLQQEMLKGNISSSCFFTLVRPTQSNGVFAINADDSIRYFINQPLADIPVCSSLAVHIDPNDFLYNGHIKGRGFENTVAFREWVVKLLNIFSLLGAVELLVTMDTYKKNKEVDPDSGNDEPVSNIDAFARINVSVITEKMMSIKPKPASSFPFMVNVFTKQGLSSHVRFISVFAVPIVNNPENHLYVAIDLRKITKKAAPVFEAGGVQTYSGTLVMPDSMWERGHNIYIFMDEKLVHYALLPVSSTATGVETTRLVMESINVASMVDIDAVEYDESDFQSAVESVSEQQRVKRPKKSNGDGKPSSG